MRKLIIQIPCLNEEATLPITLGCLPRAVPGYDVVEWLVIDDGSTDRTAEVARAHGVDHVVQLSPNQGLAKAFLAGLEASLRAGADTIVNTDADNQYDATNIPDLVRPIVEGRAQIVVGARPIAQIAHFSAAKKFLQRLGSWAVRMASGADIPDAPSGFRAIHRDAALRLYLFNDYTYTLESIIQAGRKNLKIVSVPIRVNGELRPSRLIKSIPLYVRRSLITILRIFILYKPFRFFALLGLLSLVPGLLIGLRFVVAYASGSGEGHIQSLILSAIFIVAAVVLLIAGVLADLTAANRHLLEDVRMRLLRLEVDRDTPQNRAAAPVADAVSSGGA